MKWKLSLLNISLLVYIGGILTSIATSIQVGAVLVILASLLIVSVLVIHLFQEKKVNLTNLLYLTSILIVAVLFIHGYSYSIDMPFLGNIPGFSIIFLGVGIMLVFVFFMVSIKHIGRENGFKMFSALRFILFIVALVSLLGILGIGGIIPVSGRLITVGIAVYVVSLLLFFSIVAIRNTAAIKRESIYLLCLTSVLLVFLFVRFFQPQSLPGGLTNSVIVFGFVPLIILPAAIGFVRKFHFFTVFIIYFVLLDFYFIHTDGNLKYLLTVGMEGCVGYNEANDYAINFNPGMSIDELLKEPEQDELDEILLEWQEKDFSPTEIKTEYATATSSGDSMIVLSHLVNDKKHYGLVRIPAGLDLENAPILMGLKGGGTGIDVFKTEDIFRLSSGTCRDVLNDYLTIMPSYRGNLVRGDGFCFRSQGYAGDAWLGASEDAVAFLEAVKTRYSLPDSSKTIAFGVSRGATVALIVGGLTDKLDYIIANSTHTKFLDTHVFNEERVGGAFSRAFYTPKASAEVIRKRIIASSPYYFASNLPPFEIHQGTEDQKTTIWHIDRIQEQLAAPGRAEDSYQINIYEGKGHGYDDDNKVCETLSKFPGN